MYQAPKKLPRHPKPSHSARGFNSLTKGSLDEKHPHSTLAAVSQATHPALTAQSSTRNHAMSVMQFTDCICTLLFGPPSHTLIDVNKALSLGPRVVSFRPYPNALDLEFPLPTCQKPDSDCIVATQSVHASKDSVAKLGSRSLAASQHVANHRSSTPCAGAKTTQKASRKSGQRQPQHLQGKGLAHEMAQGPTAPASKASQSVRAALAET